MIRDSISNLELAISNVFRELDAMDFFTGNILNIVCYLPLVGMILIMLTKRENESAIKWIANITAFVGFIVSIPLLTLFNDPRFISPNGFRFMYDHPWIPTIGANYKFGIDGISMLLVLLTTLLGFIAILSSWTAIKDRVKEYYAFMLLLQTGMLGVFMSLDFLVFYVFWEVFSLHPGGLRAHAGRHFGDLFLSARRHGHILFRYSSFSEAGIPNGSSILGLFGLFHRVCHQGPDVSLPHLVAGCPR
jgi:hypothetical protein